MNKLEIEKRKAVYAIQNYINALICYTNLFFNGLIFVTKCDTQTFPNSQGQTRAIP